MQDHAPLTFLKDGDASFGMFYPKNYTLAGFASAEDAQRAAEQALDHGFAREDVHLVSGEQLMLQLKAQDDDANWLDRVKAAISEFVGTETYFIDQDVALASQGGHFLLIYTPDEEDAPRAKGLLQIHGAKQARRYLPMAIERLIDPPAPTT